MAQFNTFFVSHGDDGAMQGALNAFLRSHRVVKVDKAVFPEGWAFCVEWLEGNAPSGVPAGSAFYRLAGKIDYREILSPEVFEKFAKLRERRKKIAEEDGVKPYVVMTDAQLAEIAKLENPTVALIGKIPGVGESRVKQFVKRLIDEDPAKDENEVKDGKDGERTS